MSDFDSRIRICILKYKDIIILRYQYINYSDFTPKPKNFFKF